MRTAATNQQADEKARLDAAFSDLLRGTAKQDPFASVPALRAVDSSIVNTTGEIPTAVVLKDGATAGGLYERLGRMRDQLMNATLRTVPGCNEDVFNRNICRFGIFGTFLSVTPATTDVGDRIIEAVEQEAK